MAIATGSSRAAVRCVIPIAGSGARARASIVLARESLARRHDDPRALRARDLRRRSGRRSPPRCLPASSPSSGRLDDGRGSRASCRAVSFRDVDFRFAVGADRSAARSSRRTTGLRPRSGRRAGGRTSSGRRSTRASSRLAALCVGHAVASRDDSGSRRPGRRDRCATATAIGVAADWGGADVELTGTAVPLGRLDGFADLDDGALVLTHPLDGYFAHPSGRLGRYAVWHERLRPTIGAALRARYEVFDRLGLVSARPAARTRSCSSRASSSTCCCHRRRAGR